MWDGEWAAKSGGESERWGEQRGMESVASMEQHSPTLEFRSQFQLPFCFMPEGVKSPCVPSVRYTKCTVHGELCFLLQKPSPLPPHTEKGKLVWKSSIISIEYWDQFLNYKRKGLQLTLSTATHDSHRRTLRFIEVKWLAQGLRICQLADLGLEQRSVDSNPLCFLQFHPGALLLLLLLLFWCVHVGAWKQCEQGW